MNITARDWIYAYYQQKTFRNFIQSLMRGLGKGCDVWKEQALTNQILSHVGSIKSGPILESTVMHAIFEKGQKNVKKEHKKIKYLKIWAKMYKMWKHSEKGQAIACDYPTK